MVRLPNTEIDVHPLYLGGNVFGWTADQAQSFEVLDAYADAGGNFIDTADVYSEWAPGNVGGESETIIGEWMRRRSNRDRLVLATKVAKLSTRPGLSRSNIHAALDDSLRRLQTDYVDLYYAHEDDPSVPLEETLQAFADVIAAGKVRHIVASQYSAPRLAEALHLAREMGVPGYIGLQTHYNLMSREYEGELQRVCVDEGIACFPFFGLARGFLSGKYQKGSVIDSPRAEAVLASCDNERGWTMVAVLGGIAARLGVSSSAVALEWLRRQPGVVAPLASARNVEQLREIMQTVELEDEDVTLLSAL
jgi:aryl-alcohol dehydrogenase-like predicted oxidoreductase